MRLASVAGLARAGLLQAGETCPRAVSALTCTSTSDTVQQVRSFGSPAPAPPTDTGAKNPLQQIMPVVVGIVPSTIKFVTAQAGSLVSSLATSSQVKSAVTEAANRLLISGDILSIKDVDVAKWTSWLTSLGYNDRAGLSKLAAAVTEAAPGLSAADTALVIQAFGTADFYDKDVFTALATNVKSSFTELDTDALLSIAAIYNKFGHKDLDLLDDVGDGIAYCNHYLAPVYSPLSAIAGAFEAYAAASHDRTDLFVGLARAVNEDKLMALPGGERKGIVLSLLRSFDALGFYPDVTEGLFAVADNTSEFTESERQEVAGVMAKVEAKAGGELKYYKEGTKDPAHYHGPNFGEYNLWAFRDSLQPKYYSPSSFKA